MEMRCLLAALTETPDWPTLAAHLSLALPSTPPHLRLQLQSASDLAEFWPALVRAVEAATDLTDAAAALQCLRTRTSSVAATPSWALREIAFLPGQPAPPTPHASTCPPQTPEPAVTPPPSPSTTPTRPAPVDMFRVRLTGLRGLHPVPVRSALSAAFHTAGSLPEFASRPLLAALRFFTSPLPPAGLVEETPPPQYIHMYKQKKILALTAAESTGKTRVAQPPHPPPALTLWSVACRGALS